MPFSITLVSSMAAPARQERFTGLLHHVWALSIPASPVHWCCSSQQLEPLPVCHPVYLDKMPGVLLYPVHAYCIQDVSVAQPCLIYPVHAYCMWNMFVVYLCLNSPCGISVDWFHNECSIVHALNLLVLPSDGVFPCLAYDVLYMFAMSLYHGFTITFEFLAHLLILLSCSLYFVLVCQLFQNLFLSAVLMFCVPHEHPWFLTYLSFIYVMHNLMFKHDFLVHITHLWSDL